MTIVMPLLLSFVLGILLLLYVLKCGLYEPDVQEARIGCSQPGVGLWSPHFFVLTFFKNGLTLNPHNKRPSFGLFISLHLCCIVDCINVSVSIVQCKKNNNFVLTRDTLPMLTIQGSQFKLVLSTLSLTVLKLFSHNDYPEISCHLLVILHRIATGLRQHWIHLCAFSVFLI